MGNLGQGDGFEGPLKKWGDAAGVAFVLGVLLSLFETTEFFGSILLISSLFLFAIWGALRFRYHGNR